MESGAVVLLSADESHHISRVLRLAAGAAVRLFDGRGGEWECSVTSADPDGVRVLVHAAAANQVEPLTRLTLMQSACRVDRLEWVLQKGTEIGVSEFILVETAASDLLRTTASKRARWDRIILEACKQSGRRTVPTLNGPVALEALAAKVEPAAGPALVLHPAENAGSVAAVTGISGNEPVRLLVGPESGLGDEEVGLLCRRGWQPVGLGPRILRTETAGLVAAALILASRGDLGP